MNHSALTPLTQWIAIALPLLLVAGSAAADIGVSVLALLFFLHSALRKNWQWLKQPWLLPLLAIWGYFALRNGFTMEPEKALGRSIPWIRFPLCAVALGCWLLQEEITRQRLLKSLAIACAFLSFDGLLQYATGSDILGRPTVLEAGYPRLTGPYKDPMLGITLCWIGLPFLALAWRQKHLWQIALALAIALTIFLSGERMAFLLMLLGAGVLVLLSGRKAILAAIAAAVIAAAAALTLAPQVVQRQVDSVAANVQNLAQSPYGLIWGSALNIAQEHPLLGIGSNQFRFVCPAAEYGAVSPEYRCNQHPHQLYLEWLMDGGAVGLGLFLWFIARLLKTGWRNRAILCTDALALGLSLTLFIRLWPLATSGSFFTSWVAAPFWLMLGWWLATCQQKQND